MTAMARARGLFLAGGLLVGVVVAGGTAWAASITCTINVRLHGHQWSRCDAGDEK